MELLVYQFLLKKSLQPGAEAVLRCGGRVSVGYWSREGKFEERGGQKQQACRRSFLGGDMIKVRYSSPSVYRNQLILTLCVIDSETGRAVEKIRISYRPGDT